MLLGIGFVVVGVVGFVLFECVGFVGLVEEVKVVVLLDFDVLVEC